MIERLDPVVADRIIEALRLGEVPDVGLDAIGTGIEPHLAAFERELPRVARGDGRVRFLRGDFGTGKTFFLKSFGARARAAGFATAYVRIARKAAFALRRDHAGSADRPAPDGGLPRDGRRVAVPSDGARGRSALRHAR